MFCPRCATQNLDGTKFCRTCGSNLETVALAMAGQSGAAVTNSALSKVGPSWIDKRRQAPKRFIKGGGLLTASALLGVALGVFSHEPDWIIIWLVLVGWMACLGIFSIASGIGDLLESRLLLRELKEASNTFIPPHVNNPLAFADASTSPNLSLPPSVTENTTNLLTKPPAKPENFS